MEEEIMFLAYSIIEQLQICKMLLLKCVFYKLINFIKLQAFFFPQASDGWKM